MAMNGPATPTLDTLLDRIAEGRRNDPLAPVTVIVDANDKRSYG